MIAILRQFLAIHIFVALITQKETVSAKEKATTNVRFEYSRLSLSRSRRDPLKHCETSVLRHIRCAEFRKIPIEQPNFTNEHVI